jgi:hypothetical protein
MIDKRVRDYVDKQIERYNAQAGTERITIFQDADYFILYDFFRCLDKGEKVFLEYDQMRKRYYFQRSETYSVAGGDLETFDIDYAVGPSRLSQIKIAPVKKARFGQIQLYLKYIADPESFSRDKLLKNLLKTKGVYFYGKNRSDYELRDALINHFLDGKIETAYFSFKELYRLIANNRYSQAPENERIVQKIKTVPVLLIGDFGSLNAPLYKEYYETIIVPSLDYRLNSLLPTFIFSRYSLEFDAADKERYLAGVLKPLDSYEISGLLNSLLRSCLQFQTDDPDPAD